MLPPTHQDSYVQYVSERLPAGEEVVRVRATDPDQNALLHYTVGEPVLARDKTGVALNPSSPYNYLGAFRYGGVEGREGSYCCGS